MEQAANTLRRKLVSDQERVDQINETQSIIRQIGDRQRSLSDDQGEADSLAATIPGLSQNIVALRDELLTARATHDKLEAQADDAELSYEAASTELNNLEQLESQITRLTTAITTRKPGLPTGPASPQRTRNIVISGILGLILGSSLVLFIALYRGLPTITNTGRRGNLPASAEGAGTSP